MYVNEYERLSTIILGQKLKKRNIASRRENDASDVINYIVLYMNNKFQAFGHRELIVSFEEVDRVCTF